MFLGDFDTMQDYAKSLGIIRYSAEMYFRGIAKTDSEFYSGIKKLKNGCK